MKNKKKKLVPVSKQMQERINACVPNACDARRALNKLKKNLSPGDCQQVWLVAIDFDGTMWLFQKGIIWWTCVISLDGPTSPLSKCVEVEDADMRTWLATGHQFSGRELYINVEKYPKLRGKAAESLEGIPQGFDVEVPEFTEVLDIQDDTSYWFFNAKPPKMGKYTGARKPAKDLRLPEPPPPKDLEFGK